MPRSEKKPAPMGDTAIGRLPTKYRVSSNGEKSATPRNRRGTAFRGNTAITEAAATACEKTVGMHPRLAESAKPLFSLFWDKQSLSHSSTTAQSPLNLP